MGMREIVTAFCETQPLRWFVTSLSKTKTGRRLLTELSLRRGRFESFEDAWKAAHRGRHPGHEHPEAVETHHQLASVVMPSDYAVLYWLQRISGDIRLFDYAGNIGNVFYSCSRYIDTKTRSLEWTVYDLPFVIEKAREIAAAHKSAVPKLTTSLADGATANVLLVSGALHYWEKSLSEFIEQFPHLPEHVIINRSPFYRDQRGPIFSIQASLNFAFPIVIRNEQELIDAFTAKGYEQIDRWRAAEYGHTMPFFPNEAIESYTGFYFQRKPST